MSNKSKIYARVCEIRIIDNDEKNDFLNKAHIQGTCVSQINVGAYFNEKLVAVMTFGKPRIIMNRRDNLNTNNYELARFATYGYHVVGIASKLLSYFKKHYQHNEIFSYADRRWSSGNLYEKLGFKLTTINPPNYFYVICNERKYRWNYRKDAIKSKYPQVYNDNKTEAEMLYELGIDRIWDAGTLRYSMISK